VIVRVVGVNDIDPSLLGDSAKPPHIPNGAMGAAARVEAQPFSEIKPLGARFCLETVAPDHPQHHRVAPLGKTGRDLNNGVCASRPPAVCREVKNPERRHRC
jgi:hypothetical protein